MKDQHIAVAVALVVVFGIFFKTSLNTSGGESFAEKFANFPLSISIEKPSFEIPGISQVSIGAQAWTNLQSYIQAAEDRNLDEVRRLSHQLSPACSTPERLEECHELMNSVVLFTENWRQEDFTNVMYDDKQIILSTDYLESDNGANTVRTVVYFTRDGSGEPRILSIRFCFGDASGHGKCVETDPEKRDTNENGWWDEVEMFFR